MKLRYPLCRTSVVTYRVPKEKTDGKKDDPFQTGPIEISDEVYHSIVANSGVTKIERTPTKLTFDLSSNPNPIPIWATNVYLQIAYKGQIGTKADEVAFGYKDISEPTPVDFFNNMDKICLNSNWYDAGSAQAIAIVDKNGNHKADSAEDSYEWDVYPHDMKDVYLQYSPLNSPRYASSSSSGHIHSIALINAGGHNRVLYLLTDYEFNHSLRYSQEPIATVTDDKFGHSSMTYLYPGMGIKRQTEVIPGAFCGNENSLCSGIFTPEFYEFRGFNMWGGAGVIPINLQYPVDQPCSMDQFVTLPNPSAPATVQSQPQKAGTVSIPVYAEPRFIPLSR